MTKQTMSGQVAMIEDDYTLVINRGAESGLAVGMISPCSPARGR